MEKILNKVKASRAKWLMATMAITVGIFASCNKDFDNVLISNNKVDSLGVADGKKRVLLVVLDGVRGDVIRAMTPPNTSSLLNNATYSFDGLADARFDAITNANAWTSLVTGVDASTHHVNDDDFANLNLANTPTFFTRLKQEIPGIRTVSFAASNLFNDKLAADAQVKQNFSNDEQVKNAVVQELSSQDPNLVTAQFHQADVAGATGGYTVDNTSYVSSITTLDGYLGEILKALKARKAYSLENWLVIVTSNKGGGVSGGGAGSNIFNDPSRNTFTIFNNYNYNKNLIAKPDESRYPYAGRAMQFQTNTSSSGMATLSNNAVGNFGTSGDFSYFFKIRHNAANALYYPVFMGKRDPFNSLGSNGWGFLFGADAFQLDWAGSPRPGGGDIILRDGVWHTIGFKIYNNNGVRTLEMFLDGVKKSSNSINGKNLDNTAFLRIGADIATDGNGAVDMLVRDIVLLNRALSDADMAYYMRREMSLNSPLFNNLLGWWPMNEGTGTTLADKSGKGNNFTANAATKWVDFNEISVNLTPDISPSAYTVVPKNVDIAYAIYNWMNIPVPDNWNLMGRIFNPSVNLPLN